MNISRFYLFLVFYALAFAQDDQIIKYEDLFDRNGLVYAPDQDTSFSGNVKAIWASGINKLEYNYVDGKPDAKWNNWYEGGQPEEEIEYQLGIKNGVHKQWYFNGQLEFERTYKGGIHDGKWTEW